MIIEIIIVISIIVQCVVTYYVLKLIPITRSRRAWLCIAAGVLLMIVRRAMSLIGLLLGKIPAVQDLSIELVALFSSLFLLVGMVGIAPLFHSIQQSQREIDALQRYNRGLFEASLDPFVTFDHNGIILDANEAAIRVTGKSLDEMKGSLFADYFTDPEKAYKGAMMVFEREEVRDYELTIVGPNNRRIESSFGASLYRNSSGEIVGAFAIGRDISEQKRAQALYQDLFNTTPVGLYRSSPDGYILNGNPALWKILGYQNDQTPININTNDLYIDRKNRQKWQLLIEKNGVVHGFEAQIRCQNGDVIWIRDTARISRDDDGQIICYEGSLEDITASKEAEESLRASEETYRILIENIQDGVFLIQHSKLQYVNDAFARIPGYKVEEMIGTDFQRYVAPEDFDIVTERYKRRQAGEDVPNEYEFHMLCKDGTTRAFVNMNVGLVMYQGEVASLGTVKDITQTRQYERALRTANERSKLYLDILAHDICNQIQAVLLSISLLSNQESVSISSYPANQILECVEKCGALISKVKMTENLTEVNLIPRQLDVTLHDCISMISAKWNDVTINYTPTLTNVMVLADMFLEYMLSNILENAVVHNPNEGKTIWVTLREQDTGFELIVGDNGSGLEDTIKDNLFDMARRSGGVGLHQAKQILEKYGGRIKIYDRVQNNPNEGLEVQIWLPRA